MAGYRYLATVPYIAPVFTSKIACTVPGSVWFLYLFYPFSGGVRFRCYPEGVSRFGVFFQPEIEVVEGSQP